MFSSFNAKLSDFRLRAVFYGLLVFYLFWVLKTYYDIAAAGGIEYWFKGQLQAHINNLVADNPQQTALFGMFAIWLLIHCSGPLAQMIADRTLATIAQQRRAARNRDETS